MFGWLGNKARSATDPDITDLVVRKMYNINVGLSKKSDRRFRVLELRPSKLIFFNCRHVDARRRRCCRSSSPMMPSAIRILLDISSASMLLFAS